MDRMQQDSCQVSEMLAEILRHAVEHAGKPRRDVAREVGLHKDSFLRVLRGTREPTIAEACRILEASGVPSRAFMLLALSGDVQLAIKWMHGEPGQFLDAFLGSLPDSLDKGLQDKIDDVRSKWAVGTARLVARLLVNHIDDLSNRDISLAAAR